MTTSSVSTVPSDATPLTAPEEGFWNTGFTEGAKAVRHLKATPSPGADYIGRDFFGIVAKVKSIWGFIQTYFRSDALLEQNLKDLLTVRTFLKELCNQTMPFEQKQTMALQSLSTIVAYREPDVFKGHFHSFTFNFPLEDGTTTATYRLEEIIDLGSGMKAFGFMSDTQGAPPLLLYHGTFPYTGAPACLATVKADFEKGGAGFETFRTAQGRIEEWLCRSTHEGASKAVVSGHSLGGSLGLYTAVYCPQYVREATVFSAPGVGKETYEEWNAVKASTPAPKISVYNSAGDIVCTQGGTHSIGNVFIGKHNDVSTWFYNKMDLHKRPYLLYTPGFNYEQLKETQGYTHDRRQLILGSLGATVVTGLALLTKCVIIPALLVMIAAGTWPLLLTSLGVALVSLAALLMARRAYTNHIERNATKLLSAYTNRYDDLSALRSDLKNKDISPQAFAFYYRTQFYSQGDIHLPFKVALIKELKTVYDFTPEKEEEITLKEKQAVDILFHPEEFLSSSHALRKTWASVSSPSFLRSLELADAQISRLRKTYKDRDQIIDEFNTGKISLFEFAYFSRRQMKPEQRPIKIHQSMYKPLVDAFCKRVGIDKPSERGYIYVLSDIMRKNRGEYQNFIEAWKRLQEPDFEHALIQAELRKSA